MKKTLIAIAALAATGAFAQSTVTISGTMDAGLSVASVQNATTGVSDKVSGFLGNNVATSAINIAATEDLGAGMKASFFIETNPDMSGTTSTANGAAVAAGALSTGSAFGGGQRFVGLSGGFGSIKMGSPNSATLEVIGLSNPYGTALGGGYSSNFSRLGAAGTAAAVGVQNRVIRAEKSLRYDTPNMNGFAASYNLSFGNAVAGAASTTGVQTLGLTYNAGALNVGFATTTAKNSATVASVAGLNALLSTNTGTLAAGESISYNALSANYTFGATTVYGGWTTNKRSIVGTEDGSSFNLAAKYQASGVVAVSANYLKKNDALAAGAGGKVLGLGVDYALSKRTTTYVRYEKLDTNLAFAGGGERSTYSVGVLHSF